MASFGREKCNLVQRDNSCFKSYFVQSMMNGVMSGSFRRQFTKTKDIITFQISDTNEIVLKYDTL